MRVECEQPGMEVEGRTDVVGYEIVVDLIVWQEIRICITRGERGKDILLWACGLLKVYQRYGRRRLSIGIL